MAVKSKIVQPGCLSQRLIRTIRAAVKSAEVATTCEWLVSEGYASDLVHARELVEASLYT
jgi:hypothetical protein